MKRKALFLALALVLVVTLTGCSMLGTKKTPVAKTTPKPTATTTLPQPSVTVTPPTITPNATTPRPTVTVTQAGGITQSQLDVVAASVKSVSERVLSLERSIASSSSSGNATASLSTTVNTLSSQVKALQTSSNTTTAKAAELESTLNSIKASLAALSAKIDSLEGKSSSVIGTNIDGVDAAVITGTDYLLGMSTGNSTDQIVSFNIRVFNSLPRTVTNMEMTAVITSDRPLSLASGYPIVTDLWNPNLYYQVSFDGSKTIRIEAFKYTTGATISLLKQTSMSFRPQIRLRSTVSNNSTHTFNLSVKSINGD